MAKIISLKAILDEMGDKKKIKGFTDRHNKAPRIYKIEDYSAEDYETLMDKTKRYIQHHQKTVYETELPEHMAVNQAHDFLVQFGRRLLDSENAPEEEAIDKVIEDIGKTGKLGDLFHAYTTSQRDNEEAQYRMHVIRKHVPPNDYEAGKQIAEDFLADYEKLLEGGEKDEFEHLPPQALAHKATTLIGQYDAQRKQARATVGRSKKRKIA